MRDPNYCLMKAREYWTKSIGATDQRLKKGYEALAREYILWASVIRKNEPRKNTTEGTLHPQRSNRTTH